MNGRDGYVREGRACQSPFKQLARGDVMTKRLIRVVGVLILPLTVVISLSLEGYAWASSPTEQLRAYTDQVMKTLENPTLTALARLEAVRTLADHASDVT